MRGRFSAQLPGRDQKRRNLGAIDVDDDREITRGPARGDEEDGGDGGAGSELDAFRAGSGPALAGVAEGVAYKAAHAVPGVGSHKEPPDDVTLAQKVESIAFRKAGVPKGQVSVNSDNAVIYLRGQLESERQIEELVRATHAIEGVDGVKNLLHTRKTMAEGA